MKCAVSLIRRRSHILDGHRYAIVHGDPTTSANLIQRTESVHIFDTEPTWKDLDPLLPWADSIRRLCVNEGFVVDVSAVSRMPHLEELTLDVGKLRGSHIDLPSLPSLRSFAGKWSSRFAGIVSSPGLTDLMLTRPTGDILRLLEGNSAIRSADLRDASSTVSLATEGNSQLRKLKIAAASVGDLHRIAELEHLEVLEFDDVEGLEDLSVLGELQLRRLVLEDCGPIASLRFLARSLEELVLIGTTDIVDDDLKTLDRLQVLRGRQRPHYKFWQ